MKIKYIYLLLCIPGILLPYTQLIPLMLDTTFSWTSMGDLLFANRVSALFALDLFVTATVFIVFTLHEGFKLNVKHLWAPFVASALVGASLGFPLFLYMRERALEQQKEN